MRAICLLFMLGVDIAAWHMAYFPVRTSGDHIARQLSRQ